MGWNNGSMRISRHEENAKVNFTLIELLVLLINVELLLRDELVPAEILLPGR